MMYKPERALKQLIDHQIDVLYFFNVEMMYKPERALKHSTTIIGRILVKVTTQAREGIET